MAEDGDDYIDGGAGDDVLFGQRGRDEIFGGSGNDHLIGDSGSIPLAEHGDDYLDGEEGDDRLSGDGGNDQLFGGAGNDQLYGGEGEDYLDGEEGDDILVGGAEGDVLFGGDGADYLQGDAGNGEGDGNDYLDGGAGDDILLGLGGQDELYGGDGADQIVGDNGGTDTSGAADTIYGGAGNDVIYGQGGDDVIDAGADNDLVVGGSGNDLIDGGTGDDQLQGGEGNDTLAGGEGSDMLFGESGNDTLKGGAGTDYLLGGLGDDSLDGGEGDDVYYYSMGEGNDHISDSGGTDWLVFNDIYWGQVQLGVGSMKLTIPGGEIHLDDFDADNPYAAGGIEYFQFADGTVMSKAQLINAVGFTPTGTPEADVLSGTALADTIRALAGDDVVTARGGNDIVYGGAGNDVLLGETGDDTLYGEAGNDLLSGGAGNDLLMGGDGDDSYLFQAGDGQDTVTDAQGQNAIVLGAGLTLGAITFGRQGNDLFVAIKNTTDRLTVKDWFATESHFASVMLGDGSVLDRAGVDAAMPTNQAPLTIVDNVTVIEDDLLTASGNALANDSDPEDRVLRVTNPGSYAGTVGTLTLSGNGAYSYNLANGSEAVQSLAAGQSLTEQYAYTVTDDDPNGAATAESAIVVTVLGNNDLPVLGFDSAATAEDASPISGNVLDNDHDIDVGTTLTVANAGTHSGSYGTLELGSDGAWRYSLANSSSAVQSLAAGQMVTERFDFNVSDGITTVGGALSIAVAGQNDAPILVAALADQSAAANTSWSWQLPANSFADADAGDVLTYGATLADGTVLPSWLSFDAATQTFSGRVPKSATGNVDIRVGATDVQGANAADVFTLNFAAGTGGGGGSNGGGSTGNEGIGNGVDGPPPGHDTSFNDGPGTSPGNPGAQGGNGYRPPRREDIEMAQFQIASATVQAPVLAAVHGSSANAHAEAPDRLKAAAIGSPGDVGAATDPADINHGSNASAHSDTATAMGQTDTAGQSAATQTPWLTSAAWASLADQGAVGSNGNGVAAFARWLAVEQALARESANAGVLPAWLDSTQGADLSGLQTSNGGLPDAYQSLGVDTFGLRVGSGLQVFKGLGNGVQQIM
jgi:VCBS repeat-containing protein